MATIEHVDIPDQYQHEPKDVAAATVGKVYAADGAGSGSWTSLNGDPPNNWELISSNVPTAASVLTYSWDESVFNGIRLVFNGLRTDTDSETLSFRMGKANGSDMADAAGDYNIESNDMSTTHWVHSVAEASFEITNNDWGNVSTETASGRIISLGHQDENLGSWLESDCLYINDAGLHKYRWCIGALGGFSGSSWIGNPDTIQLRLASGTFVVAGTVTLYGLLP